MDALLGVGLLGLLVFGVLFYAINRSDKKLVLQLAQLSLQEQRQQERWILDMDSALAEWLVVLELPALATEKQRQEAARQLCTVLIERLLGQSCHRQT